MKTVLRKNGVELHFEGKEAEAAFKSFIILNSRTAFEALHILELISKLLQCEAPEVSAKTKRFKIRVVKAA